MKKGRERVREAFRDKKTIVVIGLFCFAYFCLLFTSGLGPFAQILPPLSRGVFILLAVLVLAGQSVVWKVTGLFQGKWFLDLVALVLFFCEFMLSLFVIAFLSWPVYLLADYFYQRAHSVY